jgi:catechol 2,3-dioxygenase-like lactoylglutathione lyase family enzyme
MIDHTSISVNDYLQSERFYTATLQQIGMQKIMQFNRGHSTIAGYGKQGGIKPCFWIADLGRNDESIGQARGVHMAFSADSQ